MCSSFHDHLLILIDALLNLDSDFYLSDSPAALPEDELIPTLIPTPTAASSSASGSRKHSRSPSPSPSASASMLQPVLPPKNKRVKKTVDKGKGRAPPPASPSPSASDQHAFNMAEYNKAYQENQAAVGQGMLTFIHFNLLPFLTISYTYFLHF